MRRHFQTTDAFVQKLRSAGIGTWGDCSGATPDPAAPVGAATGEVWLTNEFAGGEAMSRGKLINNWNWEALP